MIDVVEPVGGKRGANQKRRGRGRVEWERVCMRPYRDLPDMKPSVTMHNQLILDERIWVCLVSETRIRHTTTKGKGMGVG
jgi:hypothetical protein